MAVIAVTVLAGAAGWTAPMLQRLAGDAAMASVLLVADDGAVDASADCACCAIAGGITRALREAHFARAERRGPPFARVVVDATGRDPRPSIAALARAPLAALRFGLSAIVTADAEQDPLALALADAGVDPLRCGVDDLFAPGLYREGAIDARGWLERARVPRVAWSRPEPWDPADVEPAVQALQLAMGERLLRLKGLVHAAGEPGPRVVQAFGHTRYPSARLPAWPGGPRGTRLELATRGLEAAEIARILSRLPLPS